MLTEPYVHARPTKLAPEAWRKFAREPDLGWLFAVSPDAPTSLVNQTREMVITLSPSVTEVCGPGTDLIDKLEYAFRRSGLHEMRSDLHNMRGLHVPVRETARILYRWLVIVAVAWWAIVGLLLAYAMATGQFDWSAG